MKTLEELQLKTSDISDILPKKIADFVEKAAQEKRYGRQLLRLNRDLVRSKGRSLHLATVGSITAVRVKEGGTVPSSTPTWSTKEVTPYKIATSVPITQESIDGAEIDLINSSIENGADALATQEDIEIFNELLGRQPAPTLEGDVLLWNPQEDEFTGDGATTIFTLTHAPVIEVDSVKVNDVATTSYTMDYYKGKIKFATAPASGAVIEVAYWYSNRGLYFDVFNSSNVGKLTFEDIARVKGQIRAQGKVNADVIVMNPAQYTDIVTDERFSDLSKYGKPVLQTGELGSICGMAVLVTTHVPDGTVLYLAKERAGWFVEKRGVTVKNKEEPSSEVFTYYLYQEFAPAVTDDNAVAISVNHKYNAEITA